MKSFTIVAIALCCAANSFAQASSSEKRNNEFIRLRKNAAVSVLSGGIQIEVGRVESNTFIYVRRSGKGVLLIDYSENTPSSRADTVYEAEGKEFTVVDTDGMGVPNHRRVMENGKSHAEIFVDGKFIEPRKQGERWIAGGSEFEYRKGRFTLVSAPK
jgi:hypothetical protein